MNRAQFRKAFKGRGVLANPFMHILGQIPRASRLVSFSKSEFVAGRFADPQKRPVSWGPPVSKGLPGTVIEIKLRDDDSRIVKPGRLGKWLQRKIREAYGFDEAEVLIDATKGSDSPVEVRYRDKAKRFKEFADHVAEPLPISEESHYFPAW